MLVNGKFEQSHGTIKLEYVNVGWSAYQVEMLE